MKLLNDAISLEAFFSNVKKGALLMLDYDGTLAPFVKERMKAFPYDGIEKRINAICEQANTRLVIISGRSLKDLKQLLPHVSNIEFWGSHGLERQLLTGEKQTKAVDALLIEGLDLARKICLEGMPKECCEIKPYSVALHWRGMKKEDYDLECVASLWKILCSQYALEIHAFDEGIELRPKGHNKGNAIDVLLQESPKDHVVAYLGDDMTDEEAFARLGKRGLKVLVRERFRPTLADLFIKPPGELLEFLDRWCRS